MPVLCLALALPLLILADPPKVASLEPANGAKDLDAAKTTKLVVTFDRSMKLGGWSLCGGGPTYPKLKGTPKKLVVEVELEPDHEYALSLNAGSRATRRRRSASRCPSRC